jgi:predicted transcriptional regulator
MNSNEKFSRYVHRFIKKHGIPETKFGTMCMGDTAYVSRLRAGTDTRLSTVDKVRAFMREYEANAKRGKPVATREVTGEVRAA